MVKAKKAISKMPKFRNEAEEARFWDTHDSTEFLEGFKPARLTFARRQPKVLVSVRLGKSEVALMRQLAQRRGLGFGSLTRMWLTEKLLEEAPTSKR
jgi:predicted DNA binding CopG/RHH family protein